jgi:hypothetical protein
MRRSARIRNRSDTNKKDCQATVLDVQEDILPWMWQGIPDVPKKDIRFPHPQVLSTPSTALDPVEDQKANLTETRSGLTGTRWITWKYTVQR